MKKKGDKFVSKSKPEQDKALGKTCFEAKSYLRLEVLQCQADEEKWTHSRCWYGLRPLHELIIEKSIL